MSMWQELLLMVDFQSIITNFFMELYCEFQLIVSFWFILTALTPVWQQQGAVRKLWKSTVHYLLSTKQQRDTVSN